MIRYYTGPVRALFPSLVCSTASPGVHLTFDDGPHPFATPAVLDILRSFGATATFFLLGSNIDKYPDMALRIQSEGHALGNHGYSHRNMVTMPEGRTRREIERTAESLHRACGASTTLFRPPYGFFRPGTLTLASRMGLRCVLWSHDSRDFGWIPRERNIRYVVSGARSGSIILLHDNDLTAGNISSYLPRMLEGLTQRGFTFEPLVL